MKRRDFIKGVALATTIITLPAAAKQRTYKFAELFGPSPFPNPIYHTLGEPLIAGIVRPLEEAGRFTDQCASTHFGYYNPYLVEIKSTYTQAEADQICTGALAYLDEYGFISVHGVGYALWFNDYIYDKRYLHLSHHGSSKGKRWQYGNE